MHDSIKSIKKILEISYGNLLTKNGPIPFENMEAWEKELLLKPYEGAIDENLRLIAIVFDRAISDELGVLYSHFRNADGVDPEMFDQILTKNPFPGVYPIGD